MSALAANESLVDLVEKMAVAIEASRIMGVGENSISYDLEVRFGARVQLALNAHAAERVRLATKPAIQTDSLGNEFTPYPEKVPFGICASGKHPIGSQPTDCDECEIARNAK